MCQLAQSASCIINCVSYHRTLKYFPAPTALERRRLMADTNHCQFQSCFRNWIAQQHQDLEELLCGLSTDSATDNEKLKLLVEKSIQHFEEYSEKRALMVQQDAPSFLSPFWCSPFENALLWIGGCRPSLCIRLVYSVGGSELNDHLSGFLLPEKKDNLAEISGRQLQLIDTLHCKTIREEDKMSSRMASLQEAIADLPMKRGEVVRVSSDEVGHAVDAHCLSLAGMVRDADRLRLSTLKELMGILTPRQGVDLLAATKKLNLSLHEWGKRINRHSGEKGILLPE